MRRRSVAIIAVASILIGVALARADYSIPIPNGPTALVMAFVCTMSSVPKQCPAHVLIDSTGVEKGTPSNPLTVSAAPKSAAGAYAAATIGTTSAQVLAPGAASVFLDINNDSVTATIACNFGGAAAITGAGSITIPPLSSRTWGGSFVPSDAVNCIASAAATPATIGVK
jgi:hypothetical protein